MSIKRGSLYPQGKVPKIPLLVTHQAYHHHHHHHHPTVTTTTITTIIRAFVLCEYKSLSLKN
jgi:hypothetical protein